jgi:hypothetical protein
VAELKDAATAKAVSDGEVREGVRGEKVGGRSGRAIREQRGAKQQRAKHATSSAGTSG